MYSSVDDILSIHPSSTTQLQYSNTVQFDTADDMNSHNDTQININAIKHKKVKSKHGFSTFNLSSAVYKGIVSMGYNQPTPIQRKSIPHILSGIDIVAMARTGSGKTAAFIIPLIEKLQQRNTTTGCRGLILSPTRELAIQTHKVCCMLSKYTDLQYCLLVGGNSMSSQYLALENKPDVIVATPGRLVHQLLEMKFSLQSIELCVLDEADMLFEMGFAVQLNEILKRMGDESHRQTLLFSATLPSQLLEFTRAGLKSDSKLIRIDTESKCSDTLKINFFTVRQELKLASLLYLLKYHIDRSSQCLIFVSTKYHVDLISTILESQQFNATGIYGTLDSTARKINLAKFRAKKSDILVVTDLAARGLDIPLLDVVINYDFVSKPKLFIHRVGRVARAGRHGTAYSLIAPDEVPYVYDLMLFLSLKLYSADDNVQFDNNDTKQVFYGSLPRMDIDSCNDSVNTAIDTTDQHKLLNVCNRAYNMYLKTRVAASSASLHRAKQITSDYHNIPLHPLFSQSPNHNDNTVDAYLKQISSFQGKNTIFEVNNHVNNAMKIKRNAHERLIQKNNESSESHPKHTNTTADDVDHVDNGESDDINHNELSDDDVDGSLSDNVSDDMISGNDEWKKSCDVTTSIHQVLPVDSKPRITAKQRKLAKQLNVLPTDERVQPQINHTSPTLTQLTTYKDSANFISDELPCESIERSDAYSLRQISNQLDVADQLAEDAESMLKARKVQRWDVKKKNYVTDTVGGDPFKKLRDDVSGDRVIQNKKSGKTYKEWRKKFSKKNDEDEEDGSDKNNNSKSHNKHTGKHSRDSNDRTEYFRKQRATADQSTNKSELRNADDIRKLRKTQQTNKLRNQKGGKHNNDSNSKDKHFTHKRGRNGQKFDAKRSSKPFRGGRGK